MRTVYMRGGMLMVYLRATALKNGGVGFFLEMHFYTKQGAEIRMDRSCVVSTNLNARDSDTSYDAMFGYVHNGGLAPYYSGSSKGYITMKIPKDIWRMTFVVWSNTTYGKDFLLEISQNGTTYQTLSSVVKNGYRQSYSFDIGRLFKRALIIHSDDRNYFLNSGEMIPLTTGNFKETSHNDEILERIVLHSATMKDVKNRLRRIKIKK